MTTTDLPRTIQASVHPDAINRVPAFFNATAGDVLNELLQNARRSGATRIDVTFDDESMTVRDDGRGIEDPAALLAFGQTGWDGETVKREQPAGMGLYALARREQTTIWSKTATGQGWRVDLSPEHFSGERAAPVETIQGDGTSGTTVKFNIVQERPGHSTASQVDKAARYLPVPVYCNGEAVVQMDFLAGAIHTEEWEGVRIGVNPDRKRDAINFHGLVVDKPDLPEMPGMYSAWKANADVLNCPRLEMTLPARKEVIETPFMEELRQACRRAIYRAISLQTETVDMPKEAQHEALGMGILLPDASARLERWRPRSADFGNWGSYEREEITDESLVIDLELPSPDRQALARAAQRNDIFGQLMEGDRRMEGYGWYETLTKVRDMAITIIVGGEEQDLNEMRESKQAPEDRRPERIVLTLKTVKQGKDGTERQGEMVLEADVAFWNNHEGYMEDNVPLVTKDSDIKTHELEDLMFHAYFDPDEDYDSDSYETQKYDHEAAYEKTAVGMLSSEDDAARAAIASAVEKHVEHEVPYGMEALIRVRRGKRVSMEITLEKLEEVEQE